MRKVISKLVRFISLLAILFVIIYRVAISPFLPRYCRYLPSCSEYMIESIKTHGLIYGLFLGGSRILRCHPFAKSGYDPVPPKKSSLNLQR